MGPWSSRYGASDKRSPRDPSNYGVAENAHRATKKVRVSHVGRPKFVKRRRPLETEMARGRRPIWATTPKGKEKERKDNCPASSPFTGTRQCPALSGASWSAVITERINNLTNESPILRMEQRVSRGFSRHCPYHQAEPLRGQFNRGRRRHLEIGARMGEWEESTGIRIAPQLGSIRPASAPSLRLLPQLAPRVKSPVLRPVMSAPHHWSAT